MCLFLPARVVALDEDGALIETEGRRSRASTLLTPEIEVGDWVVVGAGAILRHLAEQEAQEIRAMLLSAMEATDTAANACEGNV